VVENRAGASGNIAAVAVVKSPPDGYTLMLVGSQNPVNAALYGTQYFDLVHDIAPVAGICRQPNVMVVNPSFPAKTVPEFIAYAKANTGTINMASTGSGTPSHVAGELFKMMTGAPMTHVPYRGGAPALTDLLAGQVQVYFGALASGLELIKSSKLRALAVTSATRLDVHDQRQARRPRRHGAAGLARRFRQADHRRNRQVVQSGEVRGHQAGVIMSSPAKRGRNHEVSMTKTSCANIRMPFSTPARTSSRRGQAGPIRAYPRR
jgi:hypothetical protein